MLLIPVFVFAQNQDSGEKADFYLEPVVTFVDTPVVEQRQVITKQEIEEKHSENLVEVLQDSGVQILAYGPYGLEAKPQIRGFTDETVRVVIDGVCVNNPQYGTFDFSSINLDDIEKIEIVRGGFTEGISDEGSVAGTIYITTRKQSLGQNFYSDSFLKTFFNVNQLADTFSESLGYNGQLGEKTFAKLNGKFTLANNKFLFINYKNELTQRENARVIDGSTSGQITHYFGNSSYFTFSDSFYAGNKNCPGPEKSAVPGVQQDYDNRFTFTMVNPVIAGCLSLENNLSLFTNIRFYDSAAENSKHYVNTLSYSLFGKFYKYANISEAFGLSLEGVSLDSTDDGKHLQLSGALKSTTKIKLGDVVSLSLPEAVKFSGNNLAFIPKAGVSADFDFLTAKLNGYRMVQFPNMDDLYWNGGGYHGNPDLKPENGWGGEFSVDIKTSVLPSSVSVFTNYYKNKIQWAGTQPENVASAFYAGVDFKLEQRMFNDSLGIKFNGEYLYNRLLDKSNSLTYGKRIMWTPDFTASLIIDYYIADIKINLDANYVGKRYISNLNAGFMKPYVLVNAAVSYEGFNHLVPYIKLENLLNQSYEAADEYPMPGISFTVGARLKCSKK